MVPRAGLVLGAGLGALDLRARIINLDPHLVDGISVGGVLGGLVTAVLLYAAVRGVALHWCGVLTNWENHTRRSAYLYAYNAKCFGIETLAHVFPLVYLAVLDLPILSRFAPALSASSASAGTSGAVGPSIMDALTVQATSVFLVWWFLSTSGMALQTWQWQGKARAGDAIDPKTGKPDFSHEEQAVRPAFHENAGGFQANSAMALMLTYAFVFGAICPLAPLLLYLWVVSRQHWQRTALVYVFQRPHPQASPGGGGWAESLVVIVCLALAVQLPLALFCSRGIAYWVPEVSLMDRWGLLLTGEVCVLALSAYLLARASRLAAPAGTPSL